MVIVLYSEMIMLMVLRWCRCLLRKVQEMVMVVIGMNELSSMVLVVEVYCSVMQVKVLQLLMLIRLRIRIGFQFLVSSGYWFFRCGRVSGRISRKVMVQCQKVRVIGGMLVWMLWLSIMLFDQKRVVRVSSRQGLVRKLVCFLVML